MDYKFLGQINNPADLKKLNNDEAESLCEEIREELIKTVSNNGGHLASNLGVVELTVALHRVFDSPNDTIIFDVGHQCYPHKMLTGRFDRFETIRTKGGLSGFMRPDESEHDPFITGHSSNSISAAYGIYNAKRLSGEKGTAVAVIGDGAMTGGMAFEALNNASGAKSNFIIVLNDNKMSISQNVGGMSKAFTKLRNRSRYHKFKFAFGTFLNKIPLIGKSLFHFLEKVKKGFKGLVYHNNIFTAMGFNYLGPVDGHDIEALESLFKIAKFYKKPSVVHVVTTKGKGYEYAENNPNSYHGVSPFDADVGAQPSGSVSFSDIAGKTLCELAGEDNRICAITAAMESGTGLTEFSKKFPKRFFDVGIAEQHAVTFAAGLAKGGMIPFFAVYSSFLQRAYDQVLHDAAIAHLPLKLLIDRAGIVGEDGETHQGIFDVAFLATVPGINIYAPSNYNELKNTIISASKNDELCAVRYPRGVESKSDYCYTDEDYTLIKRGGKKLLVTYGKLFNNALDLKDEEVDILKLNRVYPIDNTIFDVLSKYEKINIFEEGIRKGGIGELLGSVLLENGYKGDYHIFAIDGFVPAANVSVSLQKYGLDTASMEKSFITEDL